MLMQGTIRTIVWSMMTILLACSHLCGSVMGQDGKKKKVVEVDGHAITYGEIAVEQSRVIAAIKRKGLKVNSKNKDEIKIALESRRIVSEIRDTIILKAINKYDIRVSHSEIRAGIERVRPGLTKRPEKVLEGEQKLLLQLAKALEAMTKKGAPKKEIYNKYLKGLVPVSTWETLLKMKKTSKARKEYASNLRSNIPKDVQDIYRDMEASVRAMIRMRKLKRKVTEGKVEVTKKELSQRLDRVRQMRPSTDSQTLKKKLRKQIIRKKQKIVFQSWIEKQYKKHNIKILDPKYTIVKKMLGIGGQVSPNKLK